MAICDVTEIGGPFLKVLWALLDVASLSQNALLFLEEKLELKKTTTPKQNFPIRKSKTGGKILALSSCGA